MINSGSRKKEVKELKELIEKGKQYGFDFRTNRGKPVSFLQEFIANKVALTGKTRQPSKEDTSRQRKAIKSKVTNEIEEEVSEVDLCSELEEESVCSEVKPK